MNVSLIRYTRSYSKLHSFMMSQTTNSCPCRIYSGKDFVFSQGCLKNKNDLYWLGKYSKPKEIKAFE